MATFEFDEEQQAYLVTAQCMGQLLGENKYPDLAQTLADAINNPDDEHAKQIAHLTYLVLLELAQDLHRENTILNWSSSIFMEILPSYPELLQGLGDKLLPEKKQAYENELAKLASVPNKSDERGDTL